MNKVLLLSHIKSLIFVLNSFIEYNTDFIYCKKGKQTKFLFQTQKICLNGLNNSIFFQNCQTHFFFCSQESKFSTAKEIFLDQGTFPQSKKLSLIKELFPSQGNFPQLRKFSTVIEIFHSQINFSVMEIFYKQENFRQEILYLIKEVFHKERFLHTQTNFLQAKVRNVF